jgi:hypothetical protein
MNWVFGMLLGLLIVVILWRLISQHEKKYATKCEALIQQKLDRIANTSQRKTKK